MSQCFVAQPVNVVVVSTYERDADLLQLCKTEWWGLFLFFHISGVACAQDSSPLWICNTSFYQWNQDISNVPCPLSGYDRPLAAAGWEPALVSGLVLGEPGSVPSGHL